MWQTLVTAGGLIFWSVFLLWFLGVVALVENDANGFAFLVIVAFLVALILFTDAPVLDWSLRHWVTLIIGLLVYVGLGVAYASMKWIGVLSKSRAEYDVQEQGLRADHVADKQWSSRSFRDYAAYRGYPPLASNYRIKLTRWMAYWPFSLAWLIVRYPWYGFRWIVDQMSTLFTRMAQNKFSDIK